MLSINTAVVKNPYLPQTSQKLRPIGVGKCMDEKEGTTRLLGPNLPFINSWIASEHAGECTPFTVNNEVVEVMPEVFSSTGVAALRHCEYLAKSGWCGCDADFALRMTPPSKPTNPAAGDAPARSWVRHPQAHSSIRARPQPTARQIRSWSLYGSCSGCKFAHNRNTAVQEYTDLLAEEAVLAADMSKTGRAKFSKWRMLHADKHYNVQLGLYGKPMLEIDLEKQILESLHYAKLDIPKTPWKYGILENASDDAREEIRSKLSEWKHGLDTKRKDAGRDSRAKWFTGAK